MSDSTVRGRFVWHELMTTDPQAALEFYRQVVGWTPQSWSNDSSYTLLTSAEGPKAGVMMLPEDARAMGAQPSWLVYVGTPDIEGTLRHAESLGGRVLREPEAVPDVGRFAVLADPQGAVFALLEPPGPPRAEPETVGIGDFSWHELATTDWQAAFEFYRELFGWEMTEAMDMGPDLGTYQMFGWSGRTAGGMFTKPAQAPGPAYWLPYAKVRDAKRVAQVVPGAGGEVLNGPMEVPGGDWITQARDPQGAVFAVHSVTPALKAVPKPAAPKRAAAKKTTAAAKKSAKKSAKNLAKKVASKATKKAAKKRAAPAARRAKPAARRGAAKQKSAARKAAPRRATSTTKRRAVARTSARKATKRGAKRGGSKRR